MSIQTLKSQVDCDSLPFKFIEEFNTYSSSKFEKIFQQKKCEPLRTYNIASYLRQKNDSTNIQWYQLFLSSIKKEIAHSNFKYMSPSYNNRIGKASYFLKDYHHACIYLAYTKLGNCENTYFQSAYSKLSTDSVDWTGIITSKQFEKVNEVDSIILSKFPNWNNHISVTQPLGNNHFVFFIVKAENYWIIRYDYNAGRYMAEYCFFIKVNPDESLLIFKSDNTLNSFNELKTNVIRNKIEINRWEYKYH